MSMNTKKPKKVDSLIVGGGLVGLKLLKHLESAKSSEKPSAKSSEKPSSGSPKQKVFLIEKTREIGGTTATFTFNGDRHQMKLNSLLWTEDHNSIFETFTLGKKGLTPFLGFGDYRSNTLDIAEAFTNPYSKPIKSLDLKLTGEEPLKTLTQATKLTFNPDHQHSSINTQAINTQAINTFVS